MHDNALEEVGDGAEGIEEKSWVVEFWRLWVSDGTTNIGIYELTNKGFDENERLF